ncbi:hypothetical protein DA075_04600 [Methylobacterium currus]|uniref:Helicase C-terminal domain-containing protein n=2 Tax=Methylobacterium currus TaxID=2051553 RepID=A0A2R4WT42_9HYPH|nr:hypothetical protein DA075_04600 [Methylobacterium currus]
MLTLLAFIDLCPESDVLLLSAMIKNAQELADWLNSIGKFPCVAFEDPWKPTRQARAAILYRDTEIRLAKQQHHERPIAEAFGVFNLVRGWNPNDPNSIILQSLLPNNVTLARGKYGITANRNIVAGEIAAATQIPGDILNPKVLVFAENKVAVHSIANMLNKKTIRTVPKITPEEAVYQRIIMAEFGDDYFPLNPLSAKVGVHYGNMLPCERSYAESMFRRTGGYNILVATSTLAQGLNLPCEIVVMAGTDRYDDAFDDPGREDIPVYELLNALGRAGRAGSAAAGVSIVVPGKVITFKDDDVKSLSNNDSLKNIFFGSDNCLNVDDPLTSILLDKLEVESARKSRDFQHALYRLRLSLQSDEKGVVGGFIANSLGAFRARRKGDIEWPVKRAALAAMLLTETVDPLVLGWRDQIAAHAGLPVLAVRTLEEEFNTRWVPDTLYVEDVIKIVIDCLTCERLHLFDVIRLENVERVFGVKIEGVDADIFINHAREVIRKGIYAWCSGKTIGDIERTIFPTVYNFKKIYKNKPRKMQKDWPTARNFVLNMVSDIGFGASVLSQIASALRIDTESGVARAEAISMAGSAIRYGFTSVEQIILASIVKNQLSRVEIHLAEKFLISSGELINARLDVDRSQIYWKIKGLIGKYGGVEGLLDKIKPA